jgi:MFS family permease
MDSRYSEYYFAHFNRLSCWICQCRDVHRISIFRWPRVSSVALEQLDYRLLTSNRAYMLYLSTPLWVVELVPPKGRSITAGIVGFFGVVGYIIAAYVGIGFFYLKSSTSGQWRGPLAVGCLFPLMGLIASPFLPESPRWLLTQDKRDQAWEIVKRLHTSDDDPDHEYATAEFFQMRKQMELERAMDSSWLEMLRRPSYRKRLVIVLALPFILYSTGNLVITSKPSVNPF